MPAVSNTSPISNLAYIGRLDLLREQFGGISIPSAVRFERANIPDASVRGTVEKAIEAGWVQVLPVGNHALVDILSAGLDRGESEALALALQLKAERVLIDERDGRLAARQLGLPVIGVLGILVQAKKVGSLRAVKPEVEALRRRARFFVDARLERIVLEAAGE